MFKYLKVTRVEWLFADNTFGASIELVNNIVCKVLRYVYYSAESSTQVFLVVFTMNRVVAIGWPLVAKVILTERSTNITIGALLRLNQSSVSFYIKFNITCHLCLVGAALCLCLAASIPVLIAFNITNSVFGLSCTAMYSAPAISLVLVPQPKIFLQYHCVEKYLFLLVRVSQVFVSTGLKYAYSTCAQLVLTIVLVVLLVNAGLRRKVVIGETSGFNSITGTSGGRVRFTDF